MKHSSYSIPALIPFNLPCRLSNNASRICNKQDSRHIRTPICTGDASCLIFCCGLSSFPIIFQAPTIPSHVFYRLSNHGNYVRFSSFYIIGRCFPLRVNLSNFSVNSMSRSRARLRWQFVVPSGLPMSYACQSVGSESRGI